MSAKLIPFALLALTLAACESKEDRAFTASRKQAEKTVQQTLGPAGGATELRWVVRNQVNGEEIVCAYAAPKDTPKGQRPVVTPVIIRKGKTTRQEDVGKEAFAKMQDDLCGPDWVKAR
ncbi:MAG: hypothetical protein JWP35_4093 [Caulobacter sp.]|nr:hypothetical protein [Caulobacter sp.]